VELVYFEIYQRIDFAYYREKQIQGWTRKKKLALINGEYTDLKFAAKKVFRKKL
jgi:putative endonuclease